MDNHPREPGADAATAPAPSGPDSRPDEIAIIAGKGVYPLLLADSARRQGLHRIVAVAFRGEADRAIRARVDSVCWVPLGNLQALVDALRASSVRHAIMAGQVTPTSLFTVRPDRRMIALLAALPVRNAQTIFGAVAAELAAAGIELLPASLFMESAMPPAGILTRRAPTEGQSADIRLGIHVAKTTSSLEIGQTVVLKNGTILAVEAFEGTNEAIRRAARLAGPGIVVVKAAKRGHDRRFDIPVIGMATLALLRRKRAAVLAVEARRTILLERERLVAEADRAGLSIAAVEMGDEHFA